MSSKRKHIMLTMKQKLSALDRIDNGVSVKRICDELSVGRSTVSDWRKKSDSIKKFCDQIESDITLSTRCTLKKPVNDVVDEALWLWFQQERSCGTQVSTPMLKEKLHKLLSQEEIEGAGEFAESKRWLERWRKRHGVHFKTNNSTMSCRLCLKKSTKHPITELIQNETICSLISMHFPNKIFTDEENICGVCFHKIADFHFFYMSIIDCQKELAAAANLNNDDSDYEDPLECKDISLLEAFTVKMEDGDPCQPTAGATNELKYEDLTLEHSESIFVAKNEFENDDLTSEQCELNSVTANELDTDNEDDDDDDYASKDEQNDSSHKKYSSRVTGSAKIELDQQLSKFFNMQCELCEASFEMFSELKRHFLDAHQIKKGFVRCCRKKLINYNVLNEHLQWHSNPAAFSCKICQKVFNKMYELRLHESDEHTTERDHKCPVCNMEFFRKSKLDLHLRLKHVPDILKSIECNQCTMRFTTETGLKSHIHHKHTSLSEYICDICGKIFRTSSRIKSHYQSTHNNKACECKICGLVINTQTSFNKHMRRMHGEEHTCPICKKIVKSKFSLDLHMKNVHVSKPTYQCPHCDKAFKYSVKLREHIATHTGVDLYSCSFCPRTFKCTANVTKHKKSMHLEDYNAEKERKIFEKRKKLS